jgi:hypothetical protein
MDEPEIEGGDAEEEKEEEEEYEDTHESSIQAKLAGGAMESSLHGGLAEIHRRVNQSRSVGSPLKEPVRTLMESGFGADFGAVRVHADARAAELADSVQALAFTSGPDIFFAEGQYDPGSAGGQHLLAHELAHVLQQGSASATAARGAVQLKPDEEKTRLLGKLYFFDAKDESFGEADITEPAEGLGIRPGYYEVTVQPLGDDKWSLRILGGGSYSLSGPFKALVTKAKRIFLRVYLQSIPKKTEDEPEEEEKPEEKPSTDDLTGPSAPSSEEKKSEEPPTGGKEQEHGKPPDIEKTEPSGGAGTDKTPDAAGETPGSGGKAGEGKETVGGTDKEKRGGSKYGWLGLFDLPQPLISFMEAAIEVLGDSEELIALRDTLQTLQELAEHRAELGEMFQDSSTFLEIALGLKENVAVSAIETWVAKDVKAPKPAKNKQHKGIVALTLKVVSMVRKLRKMLKPVFKVRSGVQSTIGSVGLLLEAMPVLERLIEMTEDPSKIPELDLQSAVDQFATDLAGQIKPKLDKVPKQLKEGFTTLSETDLVTYEEVAGGVTAAVLSTVPKQYKPIVWIARGVGLEKGIADNVVAPLIPKEALDGINEAVRSIIKVAEPTFNGAVDDLEKIIKDLAPGFLDEMPKEVLNVLKPSSKPGSTCRRGQPAMIARFIGASSGEPIDEDVRTEAETRLGETFGGVRLHRDAPAAEASERLNANAFSIGNDVFFGPGKFAPESSEGRRLLYHELAHTVQQESRRGLDLQPDYKDLLQRLSKRFSAAVIAELKGATTTSPAKQKQVTEIKNKVRNLLGRKVMSRTNPKLPTGYLYIPKNKGKIKTIRRTLAWIRFLPALTIDKNRKIRLAATLSKFDPRNAARAALRSALGCDSSKQEAHHCIPLELFLNPVVKVAVKNGFKFNGTDNGECISKNIHRGSHPIYTADVLGRLNQLMPLRTDWAKLEPPFTALVKSLHAEVKARRKRLA